MSESTNTSSSDSPKELLAPSVEELLDNIPGGEPNLLPEAATHDDLKVWFELWEHSDPKLGEESVELFLDDNPDPVDRRTWEGADIEPSDQYVTLFQRFLRGNDGRHRLHYKTQGYNHETDTSAVLVITLDTTAPILAVNSQLLIDPYIIEKGLSEQYLIDHGGVVTVRVPPYTEPNPGDKITAKWLNENNGQYEEVIKDLTRDDYEDPIFIDFPEALIRIVGDGMRSISYHVADRAGNETAESTAVSFQVAVVRAPHFVPYPWITEIEGSPTEYANLDPQRTTSGATAKIPDDAVYYNDDVVHMQFGEPDTVGAIPIPVPWGTKQVRIPSANIAAMFDKRVPVYYDLVLADTSEKQSGTLTLDIGSLAAHRFIVPQLEAPFTDPVSKASIPAAGVPVLQRPWVYISDVCLVTITVSGSNTRREWVSEIVLNRHRVQPAQVTGGVRVSLPQNFMRSLASHQRFTVETQVSFNEGGKWITFQQLTPNLLD
jgi:hypothetical protein